VTAASRRAGEPWFCLEQPEREGSALAALGSTWDLEDDGQDRFARVAKRWRALVTGTAADAAEGPPGSGLVAVGGFAFASDGGSSPSWEGFRPASMIVPELSLARRAGRTWITVNAAIEPDDTVADLLDRVDRRLSELSERPLPLLDPAPAGNYDVVSAMPPSHYEEAVARAVQRIRASELDKIVLAREVEVHAPIDHDPAAVIGLLREAFPACYVFAVGRGDATFLAASP
jgi:isochorismate synthase EntC